MLTIKDISYSDRPRERLGRLGPESLSDTELLAIILRTGTRKENALALASRLLGSEGLLSLSAKDLPQILNIHGIGKAKGSEIAACFELGRRVAGLTNGHFPLLNCPHDVSGLLIPELRHLGQEHFIGLYLDSRNRLIKKTTLFVGTTNSSLVHPREIFKVANAVSSVKVIIAHNHPCGDPTPSEEDLKATRRIVEAGRILGIEVVDHIIIGDNIYVSVKEIKGELF